MQSKNFLKLISNICICYSLASFTRMQRTIMTAKFLFYGETQTSLSIDSQCTESLRKNKTCKICSKFTTPVIDLELYDDSHIPIQTNAELLTFLTEKMLGEVLTPRQYFKGDTMNEIGQTIQENIANGTFNFQNTLNSERLTYRSLPSLPKNKNELQFLFEKPAKNKNGSLDLYLLLLFTTKQSLRI